eukprot:1157560-Pelagomonas_calceolata.AAC.4
MGQAIQLQMSLSDKASVGIQFGEGRVRGIPATRIDGDRFHKSLNTRGAQGISGTLSHPRNKMQQIKIVDITSCVTASKDTQTIVPTCSQRLLAA